MVMSPPETFCLLFVVASQVGADRLPVHAAVGGLKQALPGVVERVGIVRRDHDRRRPLEAVLQVRGATARRIISGCSVIVFTCPMCWS